MHVLPQSSCTLYGSFLFFLQMSTNVRQEPTTVRGLAPLELTVSMNQEASGAHVVKVMTSTQQRIIDVKVRAVYNDCLRKYKDSGSNHFMHLSAENCIVVQRT